MLVTRSPAIAPPVVRELSVLTDFVVYVADRIGSNPADTSVASNDDLNSGAALSEAVTTGRRQLDRMLTRHPVAAEGVALAVGAISVAKAYVEGSALGQVGEQHRRIAAIQLQAAGELLRVSATILMGIADIGTGGQAMSEHDRPSSPERWARWLISRIQHTKKLMDGPCFGVTRLENGIGDSATGVRRHASKWMDKAGLDCMSLAQGLELMDPAAAKVFSDVSAPLSSAAITILSSDRSTFMGRYYLQRAMERLEVAEDILRNYVEDLEDRALRGSVP